MAAIVPHFQILGDSLTLRNDSILGSLDFDDPQLPLKNFQKAHKTNNPGKTAQANGKREINPPQVNTPTPLTNKPDSTALITKGKRVHILYMEPDVVIFFITKVFLKQKCAHSQCKSTGCVKSN